MTPVRGSPIQKIAHKIIVKSAAIPPGIDVVANQSSLASGGNFVILIGFASVRGDRLSPGSTGNSLMRSILVIFVTLLAGACVPQQGPKGFVVVETFNERGAAGAQATADQYCARAGRTALASDRQWNYIGFQCVMPANTLVAQTPIPPR